MLNTDALCLTCACSASSLHPQLLQTVSVFAFQATAGRCPPDLWGGSFYSVLTFPLWVQEPHPVLLT